MKLSDRWQAAAYRMGGSSRGGGRKRFDVLMEDFKWALDHLVFEVVAEPVEDAVDVSVWENVAEMETLHVLVRDYCEEQEL